MSTPHEIYATHLLESAAERLRFQNEATLAGFKTLVLINGAAVIALLTYARNVKETQITAHFGDAFAWYIGGLIATTLAYGFAYLSQGMFMQTDNCNAQLTFGIAADPANSENEASIYKARGWRSIIAAAVLAALGIVGFGSGSYSAMQALTDRSAPQVEAAALNNPVQSAKPQAWAILPPALLVSQPAR